MHIKTLHRNEDGVISVLSVFAMLALAIVLGMVMNVGIQVDGKIRMQNAADAAAYSGALTITRGVNTLAFTNNLLCEVFSLTAVLREGKEQNEKNYIPKNLAAWKVTAGQFSDSDFTKFTNLATAITKKTPQEQTLVDTYLAWVGVASELQLPVFEEVLRKELIPKFQRQVMLHYPEIAQEVADQAATLNGEPERGRGVMHGALWQTDGQLVTYLSLPVVDPTVDASYLSQARTERNTWAQSYLNEWNYWTLIFFDNYGGKMSRFSDLWRGFTCGQLTKLLAEYEDSNLPMQIRTVPSVQAAKQAYVEQYWTFIGAAYWSKPTAFAPKLLKNPISSDVLVTYAEARVFVPTPRLIYYTPTPDVLHLGGVPGSEPTIPNPSASTATAETITIYQPAPTDWTLFNQHWTCQLVPATTSNLATILQNTPPSVSGTLPTFGDVGSAEIQKISPH